MKGQTPGPWVVERHDQDDGTVNYEIWCHTAPTYHRVVTLIDHDNENAKADAELIARAVNRIRGEDAGATQSLAPEAPCSGPLWWGRGMFIAGAAAGVTLGAGVFAAGVLLGTLLVVLRRTVRLTPGSFLRRCNATRSVLVLIW